jgi:hypothetical protein
LAEFRLAEFAESDGRTICFHGPNPNAETLVDDELADLAGVFDESKWGETRRNNCAPQLRKELTSLHRICVYTGMEREISLLSVSVFESNRKVFQESLGLSAD